MTADGTTEGGAPPADPPGGGTGGGPPTTTDALAGFKTQLTELLGGDEMRASAVIETAKGAGLTSPDDLPFIDAAAWASYGVPAIKAARLVSDIRKATAQAAEPRTVTGTAGGTAVAAMLPTVPDDVAFLAMLQVGGVLKPEPTDVMAAIRSGFASQLDAFDLDDRLLNAIETRALENDEQVPQIFYDLEKAKSRKAHAEVLKALGVAGSFVTERRKKEFLGRIGGLWDALSGFHQQVDAWKRSWLEQGANPAVLLQMIGVAAGGGAGIPGLMEAPDTGPVIDAASGVIDKINRMFAGTGVPVARSLAADAVQIQQLLERLEIVGAVGATSREEMLRKLGIGVSADVVRTERTVVQFALAMLELPKVAQPQLPAYLVALSQLGAVIPWNQLKAGIGGNGVHGKVRPGPSKRAGAAADDDPRNVVY